MSGMAEPDARDGLWSWCVAGRVDAERVRAAVTAVLQRPVVPLVGPPSGDEVLCDVWHVGGDFPTLVDCYLAPAGVAESTVVGAVAVRLGHACLLGDDTLNPTRYLLAAPDGTLRAVHVDETETDDGPERREVRPCTGVDPWCVAWPGCGRSQWAPQHEQPGEQPTGDNATGGRATAA